MDNKITETDNKLTKIQDEYTNIEYLSIPEIIKRFENQLSSEQLKSLAEQWAENTLNEQGNKDLEEFKKSIIYGE